MTRLARAPACGSGPAGVLMQYAEEPKGHPLAGRTTQSAWMIVALQ